MNNKDEVIVLLKAYTDNILIDENNTDKNLKLSHDILTELRKDFPDLITVEFATDINKFLQNKFKVNGDFTTLLEKSPEDLVVNEELTLEYEITEVLTNYTNVKKNSLNTISILSLVRRDFPTIFNIQNKELIIKIAKERDLTDDSFTDLAVEETLLKAV